MWANSPPVIAPGGREDPKIFGTCHDGAEASIRDVLDDKSIETEEVRSTAGALLVYR